MKKIIAKIAMVASFLAPLAMGLTAQAVVPTWDVTGSYVVAFEYLGTPYAHDMTLVQDGLGSLTGGGGNPAGSPHVYTWVLTSGSVVGSTIDFYADYTATADAVIPQTTMHVVGTIDPGGAMSGTWSDNYQAGVRTGTWSTTSGVAHSVTNTVVVVTGNTSAGENQPGWLFNRDLSTATPYNFSNAQSSIGSGSLSVLPIGVNALDKFIGENFINSPIADVNYVTYDFRIGAGGTNLDADQFYMSVYANFGESDDLKYYDCRYSVVPTVGSTSGFTTVVFDPNQAYPVATRGGANASPFACPAVPADMDTLSAGSNIRMFALNVGDTSASDLGLDGYLDNVVVAKGTNVTTYDFESVDIDGDGVLNGQDLCPGTTEDIDWSVSWGPNRMEVRNTGSGLSWYQNKIVKGVQAPISVYNLGYTYGCNGHQILEMLKEATGDAMNGHWKYGLSSGLVKEFHEDLADGILDGMYHLETVTVPANVVSPVASSNSLIVGHNYKFKASGTANAGDGIVFDADYSYRTPSSVTWTDAVSTYEGYGDTLLDLMVNGGFVIWDNDSVYNTDHTYWYQTTGAGAPATFMVNDVYAPNNTGNLTVDIYAQL